MGNFCATNITEAQSLRILKTINDYGIFYVPESEYERYNRQDLASLQYLESNNIEYTKYDRYCFRLMDNATQNAFYSSIVLKKMFEEYLSILDLPYVNDNPPIIISGDDIRAVNQKLIEYYISHIKIFGLPKTQPRPMPKSRKYAVRAPKKVTPRPQNMTYKKKAIPKTVKIAVWNKWVGEEVGKTKCLCCKITDITQAKFACGHIVSERNGGETVVENLKPICTFCNSSMGTMNMDEFMTRYNL